MANTDPAIMLGRAKSPISVQRRGSRSKSRERGGGGRASVEVRYSPSLLPLPSPLPSCSLSLPFIGVNSYLAQGLKPPTFMIMGLAYMASPHFCEVILSKLCFNCSNWFYAMPTNRQLTTVRPFIPCSARHFWKGAKFAGSVDPNALGPLTRGSALGPRWGLCPQTPVIGSCSALAIVPSNH